MNHVGLEKIEVCDIGVAALKLAHVLDILELVGNEWVVWVALAMDQREHGMALLPSILPCEPTRRFGQEHHHEEEEKGREHLQAPGNAPCRRAIAVGLLVTDKRAAVTDVVLMFSLGLVPVVGYQPYSP